MWTSQSISSSAPSSVTATRGARLTSAPSVVPSKSQIWPKPNYRRLALDGIAPARVRVLQFLYEWVPSKPRAALPSAQAHFEHAVQLFAEAAQCWVQTQSPATKLTIDQFGAALRTVLANCWGSSSADPAYFTARYERSARGCQLHVLLGADSPYKKLPSFKAFDLIQRQMSMGWPVPRPSHESKGFFILTPQDISLEPGAGFVRGRWPDSSANDRGYFSIFDDLDEATEWRDGLARYLVLTDRGQTRLLSGHETPADAERAIKQILRQPLKAPAAVPQLALSS